MAAFTDYLETALLNHVFAGSAYTPPSAVYVALFTTATSDAGGGTEVGSGIGYAREEAAISVTSNVASNDDTLEWATATGDWGTITHAALFDAATGGNMLAHGVLNASRTIMSGDVFRLPAGNLTITLD